MSNSDVSMRKKVFSPEEKEATVFMHFEFC